MNARTVTSAMNAFADGRRTHRRWRFYFLAGVVTGTSFGLAIG